MTSLTIVRRIKAAPDAVFAAFVDPAKIELWWRPDDGPVVAAKVDPRLGGRFHSAFGRRTAASTAAPAPSRNTIRRAGWQ